MAFICQNVQRTGFHCSKLLVDEAFRTNKRTVNSRQSIFDIMVNVRQASWNDADNFFNCLDYTVLVDGLISE